MFRRFDDHSHVDRHVSLSTDAQADADEYCRVRLRRRRRRHLRRFGETPA